VSVSLDVSKTYSCSVATGYLADLVDVLRLVPSDPLARAIDLLLHARSTGRRVYIMGNGGSATTASHFVCDLVKTAHVRGHRPLRAFALTDSISSLTAWANDTTYERIFAEQVAALVERGDVVIAISASGNSPNIVAGLVAAAAKGARTIGLFGFDGGAACKLVDVAIHIPSHDYGLVEDTHLAIGHAFTAAIRQVLESEPVEQDVSA
jgi:D-sedoheptulose 7-phosphate isomerase